MSRLEDDAKLLHALCERAGDSNLTHLHIYLLGRSLFDHVGATMTLGHSAPANSLDYMPSGIDEGTYFDANAMVRDILAWTANRQGRYANAEANVREFMAESSWPREQAARITEAWA